MKTVPDEKQTRVIEGEEPEYDPMDDESNRPHDPGDGSGETDDDSEVDLEELPNPEPGGTPFEIDANPRVFNAGADYARSTAADAHKAVKRDTDAIESDGLDADPEDQPDTEVDEDEKIVPTRPDH